MNNFFSRLNTALLSVVAMISVVAVFKINTLSTNVDTLNRVVEHLIQKEITMQGPEAGYRYEAWYSGDPAVLIEVKTAYESPETDEQWRERHFRAISNKEASFPPNHE